MGVWAAWTLVPDTASACSYVNPCSEMPQLGLVGDVTARPTNACIAIRHALPWLEEPGVSLAYVAADGHRIALEATDVPLVHCPSELLAADTDYRLVGPSVDRGCGLHEEVELLAFHTGTGPDETPPSAPGEVTDTRCDWRLCDSAACCGPYETVVHQTQWDAASDDSGVVVYLVGDQVRFGNAHEWAESGVIQPMPVVPHDLLRPDRVRAVDIAGHVGPDAVIGERCDAGPVPRDAAIDPDAATMPDAGAADASAIDAAMAASGSGGGCSIHHARASSFVLALVGLALARVRSRRVNRASRCGRVV
jgi:hypothetical protein